MSSSRERFVSAAVELVLEHHAAGSDLRQVYSYLTPGAVAGRSGLSRALIYHHWGGDDGADAYESFLADVNRELWQRAADPARIIGELPDRPDNLSDIILAVSDFALDLERGPDRPLLRASTSLALAGVIDHDECEDVVDRLSAACQVLAELLGHEPVPPLTFDDVATAITCVFMGFLLTAEVLPDRVARNYPWSPLRPSTVEAEGWPLLAIVMEGLLDAMVRPVPPRRRHPRAGRTSVRDDQLQAAGRPGPDGAGRVQQRADRLVNADGDESSVASRQRLIEAAVELVVEHHRGEVDLRSAFGYLTPGAVARRAGLSRALIYHHWGDGDDAMSELLGVVAGRVWRLGTDLEGTAAAADALVRGRGVDGLTLSDAVVYLAGFDMERVSGDLRPASRAAQALVLSGLVDPATVESVIDGMEALYSGIGEDLGLEPVAPLTWEDVSFAIATVTEGFVYGMNVREELLLREHDWTPATPAGVTGQGWNLCAVVIESMLRRMLRPAGSGPL